MLDKVTVDMLTSTVSLEYDACVEALKLLSKKAQDYNTGVDRSDYFPFGLTSYSHMIHTKSLRLVSLCKSDKDPNFESARDTLLDLINYAAMTIVELDKEAKEAKEEQIFRSKIGEC